jgi:hypothetical protein
MSNETVQLEKSQFLYLMVRPWAQTPDPHPQRWVPALFSRFRAQYREPKKKLESIKKKERKSSKKKEREKKQKR